MWTLYARQKARLNAFLFRCLRRILGISPQDHILNKDILKKERTESVFIASKIAVTMVRSFQAHEGW